MVVLLIYLQKKYSFPSNRFSGRSKEQQQQQNKTNGFVYDVSDADYWAEHGTTSVVFSRLSNVDLYWTEREGGEREKEREREREREKKNSLFTRVIDKHVCFFTSNPRPNKGLL